MIYTFGFPCRFLFYFYDEKHIVVSTINIAFFVSCYVYGYVFKNHFTT